MGIETAVDEPVTVRIEPASLTGHGAGKSSLCLALDDAAAAAAPSAIESTGASRKSRSCGSPGDELDHCTRYPLSSECAADTSTL